MLVYNIKQITGHTGLIRKTQKLENKVNGKSEEGVYIS